MKTIRNAKSKRGSPAESPPAAPRSIGAELAERQNSRQLRYRELLLQQCNEANQADGRAELLTLAEVLQIPPARLEQDLADMRRLNALGAELAAIDNPLPEFQRAQDELVAAVEQHREAIATMHRREEALRGAVAAKRHAIEERKRIARELTDLERSIERRLDPAAAALREEERKAEIRRTARISTLQQERALLQKNLDKPLSSWLVSKPGEAEAIREDLRSKIARIDEQLEQLGAAPAEAAR